MSSMTPDSQRRLVPRWRTAAQAAACGELKFATESKAIERVSSADFDSLKLAWQDERSTENAADLVASALVLGRQDEAIDAARFVRSSESDAAPLFREIAHRVLESKIGPIDAKSGQDFHIDPVVLHANIARFKSRVRSYPRNPIAWMDLARSHTVLGQLESAARAVRVATALAPENRFVLRSAARFYVHVNEPDRALALLRRSSGLRHDPWLMSAELSIAMVADASPQSFKRAKALVEADSLQPWHTGELHGALGSMALHDRRVGKVGKLFSRSLRQPTENAIAQAQWAANSHTSIAVPDELLVARHSHEALALRARAQADWPQVIESCIHWSAMEPTSARPLVLGAYVAGVALGEGETMLQFTERLRISAGHDPMVLNNHAVALAYAGRCDEASATLDLINSKALSEHLRVFHDATRGLIAYRRGDRELGMSLYMQAAMLKGAKDDPSVAAQLLWHFLREEARFQAPGTAELADELWKRTEKLPIPELRGIRRSIADALSLPQPIASQPTQNVEQHHNKGLVAYFPDGTSLTIPRN